jgi:ATP-binding cassette subfamily B multidrug efflux pump
VGQFVAFNTYMILLIWPIIAVGWVINIFQRGTASVKRIDELLKAEPKIDDRSRPTYPFLRMRRSPARSNSGI